MWMISLSPEEDEDKHHHVVQFKAKKQPASGYFRFKHILMVYSIFLSQKHEANV